MSTRSVKISTLLAFSLIALTVVIPSVDVCAQDMPPGLFDNFNLTAVFVNRQLNSVPTHPNDPAWATAPVALATLKFETINRGMAFQPNKQAKDVTVRAIHDGTNLFVRMEWPDPDADTTVSDPSVFADAIAVGIPYFNVKPMDHMEMIHMGEPCPAGAVPGVTCIPMNILFWRADLSNVQNIAGNGRSPGTVQKTPDSDSLPIRHYAKWTAGTWTVEISRPLDGSVSTRGNLVTLKRGEKWPIVFANWEGAGAARDGIKFVTGWGWIAIQ